MRISVFSGSRVFFHKSKSSKSLEGELQKNPGAENGIKVRVVGFYMIAYQQIFFNLYTFTDVNAHEIFISCMDKFMIGIICRGSTGMSVLKYVHIIMVQISLGLGGSCICFWA